MFSRQYKWLYLLSSLRITVYKNEKHTVNTGTQHGTKTVGSSFIGPNIFVCGTSSYSTDFLYIRK